MLAVAPATHTTEPGFATLWIAKDTAPIYVKNFVDRMPNLKSIEHNRLEALLNDIKVEIKSLKQHRSEVAKQRPTMIQTSHGFETDQVESA